MIGMRASRMAACLLIALVGAASAKEPAKFVVHEWGTFSTFSGADGRYLKFYPNDGDLPQFVHNRHRNVKGGLPDSMVSLETPVLYFYSDRDRTASVQVDFPKGMMTDWYPQASRPPVQGLRWDNLKITAKNQTKLIEDKSTSRYFAARETDAAFVQATEQNKLETEKFLFYRGVADFAMPFTFRAHGGGRFTMRNDTKDAVPGFFFVRVQGTQVYFEAFGSLSPGAEMDIREPKSASTPEKLGDAMAKLLVAQGLYEKEARAMVKTWSKDWFGENGTRVLYLVPGTLPEQFLPLRVDPKPNELVRVLVGRHDLLTPEREKEVDALVNRLDGESNAVLKNADAQLNALGRYRWAAQTATKGRLTGDNAARPRR